MVRTRGHPIALVILGIFLVTLCLHLRRDFQRVEAKKAAVAKWPLQPGKVISSQVERFEVPFTDKHGRPIVDKRAYPRIVYRYEINGQPHTNETQRPFFFNRGGFAYAEAMKRRFHPNADVQVHVNPSNPYDSELKGLENATAMNSGGNVAVYGFWIGLGLIGAGSVMTFRRFVRLWRWIR